MLLPRKSGNHGDTGDTGDTGDSWKPFSVSPVSPWFPLFVEQQEVFENEHPRPGSAHPRLADDVKGNGQLAVP
jgi:hypothetical protein